MTTLVGTHHKFKAHLAGYAHPECPARLDAVLQGVQDSTVGELVKFFEIRPISPLEIIRVHKPEYVHFLHRFSQHGGQLDADTLMSVGSWEAALIAAGSGLDAIQRLRQCEADAAFLAVRPPGHHASADLAMGFCLFNNVAVASKALLDEGEKILIFDYDAHHGNGTQQIFLNEPDVMYVSLHQRGIFPGTGSAVEVGIGKGFGTTINIPVPAGTTGATYMRLVDEILTPEVEKFQPTWVIASAGFDAHYLDPLTNLGLTSIDFAQLISWLFQLVPAGRRLVFLEGGYDLEALRMSVAASLAAIEGVDLKLEAPDFTS